METSLLAQLDVGPTYCCLTKVMETLSESDANDSQQDLLQELLGFSEEYKFKVMEMEFLLSEVKNDHTLIESAIPISVAKWIFHTNQMEKVGPNTLEDTLNIINHKIMDTNLSDETRKPVMQIYELLKLTYNKENYDNEHISSVIFDEPSLKKWFSMIMPNYSPSFRTYGCKASTYKEVGTHTYPNHSIVPDAIRSLCKFMYQLSTSISLSPMDSHKRLMYVFALAAFAQFHFVDIHPFPDGNGRLCRFLSKRILDWAFPFPFPMFMNRDVYFSSLIEGRKIQPKSAPKFLMELLLDSAIDHYKGILAAKHIVRPMTLFSTNELKEILQKESMDMNVSQRLLEEFDKLRVSCTVDVPISNSITYRLTKIEYIDFDEL